jgi:hypothetical protein
MRRRIAVEGGHVVQVVLVLEVPGRGAWDTQERHSTDSGGHYEADGSSKRRFPFERGASAALPGPEPTSSGGSQGQRGEVGMTGHTCTRFTYLPGQSPRAAAERDAVLTASKLIHLEPDRILRRVQWGWPADVASSRLLWTDGRMPGDAVQQVGPGAGVCVVGRVGNRRCAFVASVALVSFS